MRKIDAVIFDWAGTTVDYGCFAPVQAFVEAFKSFGIEPTTDEVREPMGMLKRDHVETMMKMPRIRDEWKKVYGKDWTDEDVDRVYTKSENSILDVVHEFTDIKPFVIETVEKLREKGIKIGSTTGYTSEMMAVVVPKVAENGYSPDAWFSPDLVENIGRPYPFMVFRNLEKLKIANIQSVIKVGDTVADIKEGKNAGIISVGVVEGSSIMGLSQAEYDALSDAEKEAACKAVRDTYEKCGADYVIQNMSELCTLIEKIESEDTKYKK